MDKSFSAGVIEAKRQRDTLSRQIRSLYALNYRAHQEQQGTRGSDWRPSKYWERGERNPQTGEQETVWRRIARFVLEHRLEPVRFMERQFRYWKPGSCPLPNQLVGPAALTRYQQGQAEDAEEYSLASLRRQLEAQLLHFQTRANFYFDCGQRTSQQCWRLALEEPGALTPLFRYALAVSERLNDLTARWEMDAVLQYLRAQEHYREAWAALLPAEFDQLAGQRYRQLLAAL